MLNLRSIIRGLGRGASLACLLLSVFIAACGGGSGGSSGGGSSSSSGGAPVNSSGVIGDISGGTFESATLSAPDITDENGTSSASFSYQWLANGVDIPGATESSYLLTLTDVGDTISVTISYVDDDGFQEGYTSSPTAAIVANEAPSTEIIFPPVDALTDAASITVRGTATSGGDGIAAVSVNGITATTSDGYANWQAVVPLSIGNNTFEVTATADAGSQNMVSANVEVEREYVAWLNPYSVVVSSDGTSAYILDGSLLAVVKLDFATGVRTIVSGQGVGSGIDFDHPRAMTLDESGENLLVAEPYSERILSVNIATGERALVAESNVSGYDGLDSPFDIELVDADSAIILDTGLTDALHLLDLVSGDTFRLTWASDSGDILMVTPRDFVLTSNKEIAYVVDTNLDALIEVNLRSSVQFLVSSSGRGTGPEIEYPRYVELDPCECKAYVADTRARTIYAIDLATGNRSILSTSDGTVGAGPTFSSIRSLLMDGSNNRLIVSDANNDALYAIDLSNGDRELLSSNFLGEGQHFVAPDYISYDSSSNRVLVTDWRLDFVSDVNLTNGNRLILGDYNEVDTVRCIAINAEENELIILRESDVLALALDGSDDTRVVSSASVGTGPAIENYSYYGEAAFDNTENTLVISTTDELVSQYVLTLVDMESGDRIRVQSEVGTDLSFIDITAIAPDLANDRIFIIERDSSTDGEETDVLVRVDLSESHATGTRSIISDDSDGQPLTIGYAKSMLLEEATNSLLISDTYGESLVRIDIATGSRTVVSNSQTGNGVDIIDPSRIASSPFDDVVFLSDFSINALLAVDTVTGDRVIISK